MGKAAADEFEAVIHAKPACVIGLATGSTPLPLYRELIAREQAGLIDFSRVRSANLDEYKGLAPDHPQSYRRFMQENLFDHISIKPENTIVPDGLAADIPAMCEAYERKIEDWGGVDIQLLGIGHDGHIGFNEPCDHFPVMTHEVQLTDMTREANKRFFYVHRRGPDRRHHHGRRHGHGGEEDRHGHHGRGQGGHSLQGLLRAGHAGGSRLHPAVPSRCDRSSATRRRQPECRSEGQLCSI